MTTKLFDDSKIRFATADWPVCPTCRGRNQWAAGCNYCHPLLLRIDTSAVTAAGSIPLWWAEELTQWDWPYAASLVQLYSDPKHATTVVPSDAVLTHLKVTDRHNVQMFLELIREGGIADVTDEAVTGASYTNSPRPTWVAHGDGCGCRQLVVRFNTERPAGEAAGR